MGAERFDVDESANSRLPSGPVQKLVAELADIAENGRVTRSEHDSAIANAALPARSYAEFRAAIASAGIEVVDQPQDEPVEAQPTPQEPRSRFGPGWNRDGFDHFVSTNRHRVLDPTEEHELAVVMRRGQLAREALADRTTPDHARPELRRLDRAGRRAEEELILHNVRLVLKIASGFTKSAGHGMEREDLFQEGVLGLFHALTKFDPHKGFKLSTYATWWIRQHITRAIDNKSRAIRIPVHKWQQIRAVRAAARRHADGRRNPTPEQLAVELRLSVDEVRECQELDRTISSLDRPADDTGTSLELLLRDDRSEDPANITARRQLAAELRKALSQLPDRERMIMELRYGLGEEEPKTLEEVGKLFRVTRERIRQIESKTLTRLRRPEVAESLEPFVDFVADLETKRAADEEERRKAQEQRLTAEERRRAREYTAAFGEGA